MLNGSHLVNGAPLSNDSIMGQINGMALNSQMVCTRRDLENTTKCKAFFVDEAMRNSADFSADTSSCSSSSELEHHSTVIVEQGYDSMFYDSFISSTESWYAICTQNKAVYVLKYPSYPS